MIHPDLWADEEVGRLSRDARLLWIALFSLADDEGRGSASIPYLRRAVFGFDQDITAERVGELRSEIASTMRGITFYEADKRELYSLANWSRFQKVAHPTPSVFPPPPFMNDSRTIHEPLAQNPEPFGLVKVSIVKSRIGECETEQEPPPPTPAEKNETDPAFAALWKLLTNEHIVTNMGDVLRDDVSEMFAMCTDGRVWREAVKRAKSRDPSGANWAFVKRIMSDYLKAGTFDKPGGNGHGPPGKPSSDSIGDDAILATLEAMNGNRKSRPAATRSVGP